MDLNMGNQIFRNVEIPLLWGERAVIADNDGQTSIISLAGEKAKIEILNGHPAPDIKYEMIEGGYTIIENDEELYTYYPETNLITGSALNLPDCQISGDMIKIGGSTFQGNTVVGSPVGIHVSEKGMSMGSPLPPGLAKLVL